jgi:hypothetical protein
MNISPLKVLRSSAGYYIGRTQNGMPYDRQSRYHSTRQGAEHTLKVIKHNQDIGYISYAISYNT